MSVYYNEIDPKACAWLQALMDAGAIPAGDIDDRSIEDVTPDDVADYTHAHFFAGIGGWALALRLAGYPDTERVWTASCPCQPFSQAGKGRATDDSRHLWPALHWLRAHTDSPILFGEQVASPAGRLWLSGVRADVEALGDAFGAADLCAPSVGAFHARQRLYFVAVPSGQRRQGERLQLLARGPYAPGAEAGRRSEAGSVADAGRLGRECDRLHIPGPARGSGSEARKQRLRADLGAGDATGPMADADRNAGGEGRAVTGGGTDRGPALEGAGPRGGGVAGRMADAGPQPAGRGLRGPGEGADAHCEGAPDESERPSGAGPWASVEWLPCLDGKARPVESVAESLADGIPEALGYVRTESGYLLAPLVEGAHAKAMRLKGYGNAIVPQLAAEFISAAVEAL